MSNKVISVTAGEQIRLLADSIIYDTGWYVSRRSINNIEKHPDGLHSFVILMHNRKEDYWLLMFHDDSGYHNIETNFPNEATTLFLEYTITLHCDEVIDHRNY